MLSGPQSIYKPVAKSWILWMVMSFQAGAINVGAFLACRRFVTHTTGFATLFATEFSQKNWWLALEMATVPLFFLVGAMISAFCVDRRIATGRLPHDLFIFFVIPALLLIVSVLGRLDFFGVFNGDWVNRKPELFFLLGTLALISGLQNASVSSVSAGSIRTTHLTGFTTDLGIGITRLLSKSYPSEIRVAEGIANCVRLGIISAFIAGSTVGAFVFLRWQYSGFFLPTVTSAGVFLYGLIKKSARDD